MSRMFHRVLAASAVGAAALAAPATALAAADPGGGGAALPTSVAVHLPAHVMAGQPVTVTARITPDAASGGSGAGEPGGHHGKGHGTKGGGKGKGHGTGHRKGGKGSGGARHHAVTGEVRFYLDGKAEPPVEVSRDQASEKLRIPLGRHTLVAEYSGDAEYLASRSAPLAFALTPGQSPDPGQDEGPGQGPDGFGPDPDSPDQGIDQGDQGGQDGQDGQGQDQDGQGQGDQGGQDGWAPGAGQSEPDGAAQA